MRRSQYWSGVSHVGTNDSKTRERRTYGLVLLGGNNAPGVKAVLDVKRLSDVLVAALDSEGEQRRGETTSVREESNAFSLSSLAVNVREQTAQAGVNTAAVHVSAHGGELDGGLDAGSESLLGKSHEGLLDVPVRDRGLVGDVLDLGGHLSEDGVGGVLQVVVVQETGVRLGDEFAGRGVESHVVEAVERCLLLLSVAIDAVAVLLRLECSLTVVVGLVTGIDGLSVALDGEVAINDGVLAREVGLVKVVCVPDVGTTLAGLHNKRGIGANEHGNAASTTGGTGVALGVERDVASDNDGVTAIPSRRLNPVDGVEQSVGAAIARVHCVNTLNVVVAALLEQLHEDGLDRFGLVEKGLSTDFKATDALGVDVVLLEKRGDGGQGERVDVCAANV